MKQLVVLTGAGMSAESGIRTFRDSDGLWEEYDIMEVASHDGWLKNPKLVLEFYNARRKQLESVQPNDGHLILAELEEHFAVQIVTQNIDNLHERAGSSNVLHLHGELTKARSSKNDQIVMDIGTDPIQWGDCAEDGNQLRPHIVWFGEAVPAIERAIAITQQADILVVMGTSLNVYPAASLIHYAPKDCPVFLIDPKPANVANHVKIIAEPATSGMAKLKNTLIENYL